MPVCGVPHALVKKDKTEKTCRNLAATLDVSEVLVSNSSRVTCYSGSCLS